MQFHVPSITILFVFLMYPCTLNSQVVPVSPVFHHDVSSSSSSKKTASSSSAKDKSHAAIAQKHHQEKQDGDDRITRTNKPSQFQNPEKHASEEALLHFLLGQYKQSVDRIEDQLEILENLEHFSHKFENGRDLFAATDALQTVLLPALNSTSADVRKAACSIFGTAGQNNDIVQIKSMEAGVVRQLIHIITVDRDTRPKALFAISSLLRNFPQGQRKFLQDGGIAEIVKIAFHPETRRKSLTFLMDLMNERELCISGTESDEDPMNPRTPSSDDPCDHLHYLKKSLEGAGWCNLLSDSVHNLHSLGLDDQMVIIEAVHISLQMCASEFNGLDPQFSNLLPKFEGDADFDFIAVLLKNILAALSSPRVSPRVEL